ncbi:MAG: aminoacyl-tRNA hydrolase [Nannocystaceae bacterium]
MADTPPWLVVGLGNPGHRYAGHRHNVGFMAINGWASAHEPYLAWRERWQAQAASTSGSFGRCVVLKPQTFMNRSGESVGAAANFYRVPAPRVIVVHDEIDFIFGRTAVKIGGGHAGHNGLRDIIDRIGSRDFVRVRVGVGRPEKGQPKNWVLSDFSSSERDVLPAVLDRVVDMVSAILCDGAVAAMNRFNSPNAS